MAFLNKLLSLSTFISYLLIFVLTLIAATGDSMFFVHSASVWQSGKIVWQEVLKASVGVSIGIIFYWIAIKYMQQVGIISAELQTILWFLMTIIGIAVLSRKFFDWQIIDQIIAMITVIGILWLVVRTGG